MTFDNRTLIFAAIVCLTTGFGAWGSCSARVEARLRQEAEEKTQTLSKELQTRQTQIETLQKRLSEENGTREREEIRADGSIVRERESYNRRLEESTRTLTTELETAKKELASATAKISTLEAQLQAPAPGPKIRIYAGGGYAPGGSQVVAGAAVTWARLAVWADNPAGPSLDIRALAAWQVLDF